VPNSNNICDMRDSTKGSSVYKIVAQAHCVAGYEFNSGDIPGWGQVDGHGGGQAVTDCTECATFCTQVSSCLSYECSPTALKCNLNALRFPNGGAYLDYAFCSKTEDSNTTATTTTTAPSTTITTAISSGPARFITRSGAIGSNSCPSGSRPLSESECKSISVDRYNIRLVITTRADEPHGCYWTWGAGSSGHYGFNHHPDGGASGSATPVCGEEVVPTPPPVPLKFVLGPRGSEGCPSGSRPLTQDECIVAGNSLSKYENHYDFGSFPRAPAGCIRMGGGDLHGINPFMFNTHPTGRPDSFYLPVCAETPPPP